MILRNTSRIPTGLTPGDLFSRINRLERSASKISCQFNCWEHSVFVILANHIRSFKLWLPNTFEPRILRQWSASNFDRSDAPFVLMAVLWIKFSVISPNTIISCISFIEPCKSSLLNLGLASACFLLIGRVS